MALAPDTRATREAAQRVLADCRTADDDPPVPRDLSLARRNDGLEELLPLLGRGRSPRPRPRGELRPRRRRPRRRRRGARPRGRRPAPRLREGPQGRTRRARSGAPRGRRGSAGPGSRKARARRSRAGRAGGRDDPDRSGVGPVLRGPAAGRRRRRSRARGGTASPFSSPPRRRASASTWSASSPNTRSSIRERPRTSFRRSRRGRAASSRAARARGSSFRPAGVLLLTATDLFGEPRSPAPRRKSASEAFLSDLRDLKVGDIVVHRDYGLGTVRGPRAHRGRGSHARDGGPALRGRREAARARRTAGPHPEVRLGWRRAAARARQARRPRLGEAEVLGQEGRQGHRRPAPEALRAARGRARARVLEGLALAEGVRGGVRVHGDARPGRGDPRREAGHGVGQADGPAPVRRRGLREDRGRDAGDLQVRARRQAGRASFARRRSSRTSTSAR